MKVIIIVILALLFILTGCENTHDVICVSDTEIYMEYGMTYSTDRFKETDLVKLKNIKNFPAKVLFNEGITNFSKVDKVYILDETK